MHAVPSRPLELYTPIPREVSPVEGVSLGTTITGLCFKGGVLLACDTRTSAGSYIANRVSKKFRMITDRIYALKSGSAADTEFILDLTKRHVTQLQMSLGDGEVTVRNVANILHRIVYLNREHLSCGLIVGGVDSTGPHVFSIIMGGACLELPWAIGGSGSTYIYGLCDHLFRPDMDEDEARAFLQNAVSRAMYRDGSSGGVVRMIAIRKGAAAAHVSWAESRLQS
eukprot:gnl/Chilomastix_cuspidata/1331.p4 GENE.gnl/Chilomastix_cuspidata/1331~~gnl/Chilomastix_cuspidata/1331.p4  ORF type:complete len:226 (-),score=105.06 gnl/Chilomastix_cuspidata/1331:916-1593(-)